MKFLEENVGNNFDIHLDIFFFLLDMTPKSTGSKSKNKQMEVHQTKAEGIMKKMKTQPREWFRVFANHT